MVWTRAGEKHYVGPIRSLTRWTAGAELDLRDALQMSKPESTQPSIQRNLSSQAPASRGAYTDGVHSTASGPGEIPP